MIFYIKKKFKKNSFLFHSKKVTFFNLFNFFNNGVTKILPTKFIPDKSLLLLNLKEVFRTIILSNEQIPLENITFLESLPNTFLLKNSFNDLLDVYYVFCIEERKIHFEGVNYSFYVCCYTNVYNSSGNYDESTYRKCVLFHIYYNEKDTFSNSLKKVMVNDAINLSISNGFPSYSQYLEATKMMAKFLS